MKGVSGEGGGGRDFNGEFCSIPVGRIEPAAERQQRQVYHQENNPNENNKKKTVPKESWSWHIGGNYTVPAYPFFFCLMQNWWVAKRLFFQRLPPHGWCRISPASEGSPPYCIDV